MNGPNQLKILLSSYQYKPDGASEGYSAYKWVQQAALSHSVTLLTVDNAAVPDGVHLICPSSRFQINHGLMRRLNGEVKLDYYRFDRASMRRISHSCQDFDLVHYVAPMAPRYPCSVGKSAKRFIMGPLGGGLRVPQPFRSDVEGREEFFYKLRAIDRFRLHWDPFLRPTFKAADLIILNGKFMLDLLPAEFHGKCRFMLETGVDADTIQFERTKNRSISSPLELLYVGRVVPYKGLLYALKALARLDQKERARVRFNIIGDRNEDGYECECKKFVAESGLAGVVRFLGFKPKQEIMAYYRTSDLFVFPSLAEAGGNVLLEAMASGCPALVANCGGPGESMNAECGYPIDPKNPEYLTSEITSLIRGLLTSRDSLVHMGVAARRRIEEVFDWRRKGELMSQWYREVVESQKQGSNSLLVK
jgi:glycosyltransferase involved in cell wall biosynthesis